jgi:alpha-L-glutamate ligase-like protein
LPIPELLGTIANHTELDRLDTLIGDGCVVVKPARGAGGRGVRVLTSRWDRQRFITHDNSLVSLRALQTNVCDILAGMHSLGARPDQAMVQRRIAPLALFDRIAHRGTPDIRIIVDAGTPIMAMLRLPTRGSAGRANLHQGGVGVGIDITRGCTRHGIWHNRVIARHPDTGEPLADRHLPAWPTILDLAARTARLTGLGYLGVDLVIDEVRGPLILEANARPGLQIQIANLEGLGNARVKYGGRT